MKRYMRMARIEKYSTGIVGVIKHNIREFKDGKCPTNMEVDQSKKDDNYSLIRRGETAKEIEKYRKQIMKEVFHYNRKNIVLDLMLLIEKIHKCLTELRVITFACRHIIHTCAEFLALKSIGQKVLFHISSLSEICKHNIVV